MNVISVLGRAVQDPIVKTLSSGKKVVNMAIAVSRAGDYDADNKVAKDGFFQIEAWGATAELLEKYVSKGKLITVTGSLKQHKWVDENQNPREQVKIYATSIGFVPGQKDAETVEADSDDSYDPFE